MCDAREGNDKPLLCFAKKPQIDPGRVNKNRLYKGFVFNIPRSEEETMIQLASVTYSMSH